VRRRRRIPEVPALPRSRGTAALAAFLLVVGCSKSPERPSPSTADLTRPAAEWLRHEPVQLLRDYIRIDTSEGHGEEAGARFLRGIFDCEGISSEIVCGSPGRCNLLVRLPGRRREGALLLLNHIDVARAFPDFWKKSAPFEGKIEGGFLYGRGAYDMKSLAIAQALSILNLKRLGIVPESDVLFLAEADEETGQKWGARWLLDRRPEWFQGVAAVFNEGGTNEMVLRDVRFFGVETLQAGYAFAEFEMGREEPLLALAKRWPRLSSEVVEPHPDVVIGFDMLANHLVSPLTDPLRHLDRVARNRQELEILPDRYGAFLEARIVWSPVYPYPYKTGGSFRSYATISTPPGMDPGPFLASVLADASRSGIRMTQSFSSGPATASPYQAASGELVPVVAMLRRETEAFWPGIPFGPIPTLQGYTTSVLFRQKGFAAYGYSPIPMNIHDAARKHGNDERIFLRDYLNGVELYEDILEEFALNGGPELKRVSAVFGAR